MRGKFTAMLSWSEVIAFSQPLTADMRERSNDAEVTYRTFGTLPVIVWDAAMKKRKTVQMRWGLPAWTLHDLRRTFATGLASLGVSLAVVEKLLNHVSGSFAAIVGVYQRHSYEKEMRAAMELWEHEVRRIISGSELPDMDVSG